MTRPLKIGNASGFWGDQPEAALRLLTDQPDLDYLTLDYLAEVSLSIMAAVRAKDANAGYARDFVDVVSSLCPFWSGGGTTRIVTNAGGLNPRACAEACVQVLCTANLRHLKVAVVEGDDVLTILGPATKAFANLETGRKLSSIAQRLVTANAYLGSEPIADALLEGADIVITGRVADPSLTVGPCMAQFGWSLSNYDRLAGATVAGHLIECGTQACGGFSTDWINVPGNDAIGFPFVEISEDGSCVVTKPKGTGGAVTVQNLKEQLLYEIGDPGCYVSPDVTVSLLALKAEQVGPDRVLVSGATGRCPTNSYKVSATYRDGYKAHGMITVFGHDAVRKARIAGEGILHRLRTAGCEYREHLIECLGSGDCVKGIASNGVESKLVETVLRISVAADAKPPVERFTKEIAPLVTCGPQGVTGYASGRPKVLPIFGYWPTLIAKHDVKPSFSFVNPSRP